MFFKFPELYLSPNYETKDIRKGDRHVLEFWLQECNYG